MLDSTGELKHDEKQVYVHPVFETEIGKFIIWLIEVVILQLVTFY